MVKQIVEGKDKQARKERRAAVGTLKSLQSCSSHMLGRHLIRPPQYLTRSHEVQLVLRAPSRGVRELVSALGLHSQQRKSHLDFIITNHTQS